MSGKKQQHGAPSRAHYVFIDEKKPADLAVAG
jgi:hypothetical protein